MIFLVLFIFLFSIHVFDAYKNRLISPQHKWGLIKPQESKVEVEDVVAVLGRYSNRQDFYIGEGYSRKSTGDNILDQGIFYNAIKDKKFNKKDWPLTPTGELCGTEGLSIDEIKSMEKRLSSSSVTVDACDAIFTSFAKGATNGLAFPAQVDEEMNKWLTTSDSTSAVSKKSSKIFNLQAFESSLWNGRFQVFLGWFLYIGLQFGGVYVVFFVPIMQNIFHVTDVDFYPIQTYLHTETWR